ncbi:MAG: hypothetical protein ACYTGV_19960 [Planctomycetota bacterium]|jgi:hypothetical protein
MAGERALNGSQRARQITVVMLEALSGELSTSQAAEKLGLSLSRYYQLEARGLNGMLQALEPRGKGPRKTAESELKGLREERKRLEKELRRHQALLRAAQRSVGLKTPKTASCKGRVRAKRGSRGQTVRETLRRVPDETKEGADGTEKRHAGTGGRRAGQSGCA